MHLKQKHPGAAVVISGQIYGLSKGLHGFHIHMKGALTNECKDAGGHFNPTMVKIIIAEILCLCAHLWNSFPLFLNTSIIDPPVQGRIGGHYFHAWCPYVRLSQRQKTLYGANAKVTRLM